jgi:hypothetical protein
LGFSLTPRGVHDRRVGALRREPETRVATSSVVELEALVSASLVVLLGLGRGRHRSGVIGGGVLDHLAFDVEMREAPVEPLRQLPVPASKRVHDRRDENGPDDDGVD